MELINGQIVGNQYRVESFLGKGAMASVYKVWDTKRLVYLAMKVLSDDLAEDVVFLRRFRREAQTLKSLQHPNIVRFYELGQDEDLVFMLMDFVDGSTLRKEIYQNRGIPFTAERIIQLIGPICAGLHYAHQQNVIHCDIKPANIMLDSAGKVLIADFGIARLSDAATTTMVGAGTPAYMSPEQSKGRKPTPQSDIYALGAILYEMLTGGERPFTGERSQIGGSNSEKILWEKLNLNPIPPSQYNSNLPAGVDSVIAKCLANDPQSRYDGTLQLYNELQKVLSVAGRQPTNLYVAQPVQIAPVQKESDEDETGSNPPSQSQSHSRGSVPPALDTGSRSPNNRGLKIALFLSLAVLAVTLMIYLAVVIPKNLKTKSDNSTGTVVAAERNLQNTQLASEKRTQSVIQATATAKVNNRNKTSTAVVRQKTATQAYIETANSAYIATATMSARATDVAIADWRLETAQSEWDSVLYESFSDNSNNWYEGTEDDSWGVRTYNVQSGIYRVSYSAESPAITWVDLNKTRSDVYISVDIKMEPSSQNVSAVEAGILFGESDRQYFYFELDSDGSCALSGYNRDSASWLTVSSSYYCGDFDPDGYNRLEIVVDGHFMTTFVNGEYVNFDYIPEYASGKVGVVTGLNESDGYADFYFDNMEIRVP